jgi:hypothetical protein
VEILDWITTHWLEITAAATLIVGAARIIVMLTPTPKDDAFLEKVVNALKIVGLSLADKGKVKK